MLITPPIQTKHTPSRYQQDIYNAVINTDKNIVISASAGTGKTLVLIECAKLVDPKKEILFTAFNKTIVEELSLKLPSHIFCSTLHSIGMRALMSHFRTTLRINEFKTFPFIEEIIKDKSGAFKYNFEKEETDKKALMAYKFAMRDAINLARMTMNDLEEESLFNMCTHYDISLLEEELCDIVKIINRLDVYNRSLTRSHNYIDFIDMIHIPVTNHKVRLPQFDYAMIDESQDNNACQHKFIERLLAPKARTIYVGDEFQCIYSFMGGDVNSFKAIQERPNSITLPLSISYRCAKQIVAVAQQVCPSIEPYENNEEGEVRYGTVKEIKEGDLVLSRNNRPLFYLYFQLLEDGVNAIILGKDIEVGLQALISKVKKKDVDQGVEYLSGRLEKLKDELKAKGVKSVKEHPQYTALYDKVRTIAIVANRCDTMNEVSIAIEKMFSEKDNCVKLSTIHHAKGAENDRVFHIERFNGKKMLPSPWAESEWQKVQERNLTFVMLTRAKKQLIFIQNVNEE